MTWTKIGNAMTQEGTRVFLARHGETAFNRDRFLMGRADSELTQAGIRIAGQVARFLSEQGLDAVYSSPLGRAVATARIYVDGIGLGIVTRESMAELACGTWEGRARMEVKPEPGLLRASWDERPPGGESYRDAEDRVGAFIQEIRTQTDFKRVLIVGHAGVNRVFLRLWMSLQPDDAIWLKCPHDTVFILEDGKDVRVCSVSAGTTEGLSMEPY